MSEERFDFEAEGLLEGCDESTRSDRIALLEQLFADGVTLEEVKRAIAEDRLFMLPVERVLAGSALYTAREVAERSGVSVDFLLALRRALGVAKPEPDDRSLSDHDLDAARLFARFLSAGMEHEALLDVARILGRGLSAGADAFRGAFGRPLLREGLGERELAMRNAQIADELLPLAGPVLAYILRLQLLDLIRDEVVGLAELRSEGRIAGSRQVAVCFADVVGFTPLAERGSLEEPGDVARALEGLAAATVESPVRLIKTLGDAVMLVSGELDAAADAALRLVEAAQQQASVPALRAGLAWGTAVNRSGDWFGPTVNRASRLADAAEPGSLVCDAAAGEALGATHLVTELGQRELKGIEEPVAVFEVRRRDL